MRPRITHIWFYDDDCHGAFIERGHYDCHQIHHEALPVCVDVEHPVQYAHFWPVIRMNGVLIDTRLIHEEGAA